MRNRNDIIAEMLIRRDPVTYVHYNQYLLDMVLPCLDNYLKVEGHDHRNSYYELLMLLIETPFTWVIRMDENRAEDGFMLRKRYYQHMTKTTGDPFYDISDIQYDANMLEVLIGLSLRMEHIDSNSTLPTHGMYFWELVDNLGLLEYHDDVVEHLKIRRSKILRKLLDRTYDFDGYGGLFPLRNPKEDQRDVDIWYQMHAYFDEKEG